MSKTYKYILDFVAKTGAAKKEIGGINSSLKKAAGAAAALFSVGQVISFGKEALAVYDVQAKAERGLLVALKGRTDVQQRLIQQAQDLQKVTLFGDEATIQAQALIAAFVKEEEQIKRVIPLVQDLATAKNMDLAAAADLVSKTLGSSTNALARYGIQVEGAVGSTERLESLTGALAEAFGGQAVAAAEEGTGSITQLSNAIGDLKEVIGELIVSGEGFTNWIRGSKTEIEQWTTILSDDRGAFKNILLFLTGSRDKWAEVAAEIEKNNKQQNAATSAIDAYSQMIEKAKLGIDQLVQSETENNTVSEKQVTTYGDLIAKIAEKNDQLKQADITDTAYITTLYAQIAALEEQKKAFEALSVVKKITPRVEGMDQLGTIGDARVEGGIDLDASRLDDMTPFLEQQLAYVESLRTGWASFGEQFDMVMERMAEGGERITGAHILAADMMSNLMGLAYRGADSMKEWAAGVKDAAMSSINAFIAEGVAGAVSKSLSSVPFPLNMVLGAAAAAAATGLFNSVIPKFELGGVVPGTSFYGDKMLARVNSGEEILRRDDPRHRNNYGEPAGKGRDRLIIPNLKLRKGDIYVAFQEAEREILKRT